MMKNVQCWSTCVLLVIDDKVRFSLNASLSSKASVLEQRLNQVVADFDAKCDAKIEQLGAECSQCAESACSVKEPKGLKALVSKLKDGVKKISKKIKDNVKKVGKAIGKTVKKVWRSVTRGVSRVIRRTARAVTRVVRRVVSRTVRHIGRAIRRVGRVVGRVVRRVGRVIRRVGRFIRRVVRIRFRFRRWGKRNTDALPACALNCVPCRTLVNSATEDVCGRNYVADQLLERLELIEEALNATHDDSWPMVAKVRFNGQASKWVNNDLLFSEVKVTANINGQLKEFQASKSLPLIGDVTEFANAVADQIWTKYNTPSTVLV